MLGRDVDSELEVTACEPPRRLTLRALSGPVRFTVDHELSEQNGGTLLAVTAEGKATGMLRFAGPMVQRTADQELRQDFARLKEILEAG
jgi:carbon monoxide dehydrogenase subunit G